MYAQNPYLSSESAVFSLGSPMVDLELSTEEKCEPKEGAGIISVSLPVVAPATEIEVSGVAFRLALYFTTLQEQM